MGLINVVVRFACLLVVAFVSACHGCSSRHGEASAPEPVEECLQYEATLNACHHRNLSIANQPTLLRKSDEERDRIKQLCSENLQRIRTACGLYAPLAATSAKPR